MMGREYEASGAECVDCTRLRAALEHAERALAEAERQRAKLENCHDPLDPCRACIKCLSGDYEHALNRLAAAEQRGRAYEEALGFIESAALFHPNHVWPDEMRGQLRRIGKLAHDALSAPPSGDALA
jgi:hypothetical protein